MRGHPYCQLIIEGMFTLRWLFLIIAATTVTVARSIVAANQAKRTSGGIHLPLIAQRVPGQTGAIGLGDFHDV